jgi:two-component system, sensor histidine kinase YesM
MKAVERLKEVLGFMGKQKYSFRTKLFFTYFAITLVLIVSMGVSSYNYSSKSVEEKLQEANIKIIDQINKNLESNFLQIKNIMLIPYNNSDYITDVNVYSEMSDLDKIIFQRKMGEYFLTSIYITQKSDLENFFLYTKNGELLFTSSGTKEENPQNSFMELPWVQGAIKKNGAIFFSSAYKKTVKGREKLLFSASIKIKDISSVNRFSVVKAEFNFDVISDICGDVIGKGSETVLADDSGKVIYSTGGSEPMSIFNRDIGNKISGNSGTFWAESQDREYMVSYAKSAISGWNIISIIPRENVFDASIKIGKMTVMVSILGLLLAACISLIFSSGITKPLLKLDKMVDSVKKGDLSVRMKVKSRDEIGRINQAFNDLLEEVNSLIETKYIFQIKEREYELNLLYGQINPHFLYNTLDNIRAMAASRNADDVANMINLLADMLRYGVKDINESVTVKQELDHIMDYLMICNIRFGEKIDFNIQVNEAIMNYKIPRLILQPIIENSIMHGFPAGNGKEYISITGEREGNILVFAVKDDGVGMNEDTLNMVKDALKFGDANVIGNVRDNGIGLVNINSRLKLLYGDRDFIKISSSEYEGTKVQLLVPINVV